MFFPLGMVFLTGGQPIWSFLGHGSTPLEIWLWPILLEGVGNREFSQDSSVCPVHVAASFLIQLKELDSTSYTSILKGFGRKKTLFNNIFYRLI